MQILASQVTAMLRWTQLRATPSPGISRLLGLVGVVLLSGQPAVGETSRPAPNVILILTDDQGWGATSVQMDERVAESASDFVRTPHLARLAARGVRFSRGYSPHPNCSPSRYAIQTGKSPAALRMTDIVQRHSGEYYEGNRLIPPSHVDAIADEEITLAEWIKRHRPDYATAHFGKWHLAGGGPVKHGYDAGDPATGNAFGNSPAEEDPKLIFSVTERATNWMGEQVAAGRPFFLQVSHYATHLPIQYLSTTHRQVAAREPGARHTNVGFAAMSEDLDAGVGRVLERVRQLEIEDNTYVIYLADNGTYPRASRANLNGPLHGWKATVWEGGIRVPFVVAGPGIEPAQCDQQVVGYDLFPTVCSWLGIESLPQDLEGGSLESVLTGQGRVQRPRDFLVFHWPHYQLHKGSQPSTAIYQGRYKLIRFWETDQRMLFDLDEDLAEQEDLATQMPQRVKQLDELLTRYLSEVGAGLLQPNPEFSPTTDPGRPFLELKAGLMTRPFPMELVR
ncbi:MAG: DUF4976 domain-containing protein [Planctomycetota bacterium]|nr:MAG: DUF4976 domain-containing protein [Planctomycetota bacterium]